MTTTAATRSALAETYEEHLRVLDRRLGEALAAAGFDSLAVYAGQEKLVFRDDLTYPFRVEPYFKAWLPLTDAQGSWLKLVPGRTPVLIYLQEEGFWMAPARDPEGYWTRYFDIRIVRNEQEACSALRRLSPRDTAIGDDIPDGAGFGSVNDPKLLAHLDFFRAWKTPYEIENMARAAEIAVRGHRAAGTAFGPGISELDLHQRYNTASGQREAELPYGNIVALNEHASVLHYQHLDREPPSVARSFLLDAGAEFNGYAADVTRTWTTDRGEFAALIDSMDSLQQALCAEARTGVDYVALNDEAHRKLAGVLEQHGLVTCGAEEAYQSGITRAFLPHGLGHLLGLQVHDAGGRQTAPDGEQRPPPSEHPFLRLTRVLEPGFALTIEPGLYFIPSLLEALRASQPKRLNWPVIERLIPFGGVRVEDDVVITDGAPRNLSRAAFGDA